MFPNYAVDGNTGTALAKIELSMRTAHDRFNVACVAGVEGEGKGKKQLAKHVSVREGDV